MRLVSFFAFLLFAVPVTAEVVIDSSSEIVIPSDAPYATRLAAEELNRFLKGVLGVPLQLVAQPTEGRSAIILGDRLRSTPLPRDAFVIEVTNGVLRIFGNDDDVPGGEISKTCWYGNEAPWQPHFRRGTLFGVYEFLERFAGVRMYFPDALGTIIPSAERLAIPEGRLVKAPAFRYRRYGFVDGPQKQAFKLLNWYRLRMETETMKCSHGHRRLKLYERFGKTHPGYFANHHNRHVREQVRQRGYLCHTSCVWDEIEKDAIRFFSEGGTDAFDLQPQDGMTPRFRCNCPSCIAAYGKGRHYATDLVWRHTAEVAAHVQSLYPKARFTQMAYNPYGGLPDFAIPDNVDVTVARRGPWALALPALDRAESDEVRAWADKLGRKVVLWNYPGKWQHAVMNLPGVPQLAPRAWAAYYKALAPVIDGAFAESESDRWSYNYLNYYVFSRVCWDPQVDVEALLAEHHRLMFGSAAKPMAAFYDMLERKWTECVAAGYAEILMDSGLVTHHDMTRAVRKIYAPAVIRELENLLTTANSRATDPLQVRRIAWLRSEYLIPLKTACQ